jgi:hypothetical protein
VKAHSQFLVSCLWNNDWVFRNPGHVQFLKSRNRETELFHLWNYFLDKVIASQTINAGYCASGGLGPSNKIDQAQSRTKLRNFGRAATRTKRRKASGHCNKNPQISLMDSHKNWTSLYPV